MNIAGQTFLVTGGGSGLGAATARQLVAAGANVVIADINEYALDVSRQQQARAFELRAATSLARMLQSSGRTPGARAVLEPVLNWFTEGHGTADLVAARTLLSEIG